jgi:hypothetical protein
MRHSIRILSSAGILTCCPSTTPFGLALGPTNPGTIRVAQETLGFRWAGILTCLYATYANILTSVRSTVAHPFASALIGMLLYQSSPLRGQFVRIFGIMLSPDNFRRGQLDQ